MKKMRIDLIILAISAVLLTTLSAAADTGTKWGPWRHFAPYYFPPSRACMGYSFTPKDFQPRYQVPNAMVPGAPRPPMIPRFSKVRPNGPTKCRPAPPVCGPPVCAPPMCGPPLCGPPMCRPPACGPRKPPSRIYTAPKCGVRKACGPPPMVCGPPRPACGPPPPVCAPPRRVCAPPVCAPRPCAPPPRPRIVCTPPLYAPVPVHDMRTCAPAPPRPVCGPPVCAPPVCAPRPCGPPQRGKAYTRRLGKPMVF